MAFFYVPRPYEYIISCMGEFHDIATPGPYITIPGLTRVVTRVKVDSTQFLNLFREETKPVLLLDGVKIKPTVVAKIRIMDPYAVTYNISIHDYYVAELEAINVRYRKDEKYFYGLEEILTTFVRKHLATLNIEEVLELNKEEKGSTVLTMRKDLTDYLQLEADKKVKEYGVDVEEILIPEVEAEESVLTILRKKFEATQNKKIAELQEKVEKSLVKVEAQKKLQQKEIGAGKGYITSEQMTKLLASGLTPEQAINYIATKGWSDAAEKGADFKVFSMSGADGKMSVPVMTGIGMGIGQKASEDEQVGKKDKEAQAASGISESQKSPTGMSSSGTIKDVKKGKGKGKNSKKY